MNNDKFMSKRRPTMNLQKSSVQYSQLREYDDDGDREVLILPSEGNINNNNNSNLRRFSNPTVNWNRTTISPESGSVRGDSFDENDEDEEKAFKSKPNARKDLHNIAFLMFLYLLQGVPLGLTGSLPFILGSRNVSYTDQGTFSFAFWPFCLKLLWAPVVDSIFVKKFGRRKSWVVPMQCIIGLYMIFFSTYVHRLLEVDVSASASDTKRDIYILTAIFFVLTFFTATQDIAVDGWGLTILSKENVAWSSTCNNTGQTAGWFIGNVLFLVVESADFSNKYFRPLLGLPKQEYGIVPIDKFMQFFGVMFLLCTTFVMIFKTEKECDPNESLEDSLTLTETYKLVWKIMNLKSVQQLSLLLLTFKIAFSAQGMTYLKLIENGVAKESLGLMAIPLTPVEIVLPVLISKYTNGPKPLTTFSKVYPFRIITCSIMVFWCFLTPYFKSADNSFPFYYFLLCVVISGLNSSMVTTHSVAQVAFFTRVSDKTVGGTYMTLLNTIGNIGASWPNTLVLFMVDFISVKYCSYPESSLQNRTANFNLTSVLQKVDLNHCTSELQTKECIGLGGKCNYTVDAFYIIAFVCSLFGVAWVVACRRLIKRLESHPKSLWKISFDFSK